MCKDFAPSEGKSIPAMLSVLTMRQADCIGFKTSPVVLMATFSRRLESRGLIILYFREKSKDDLLKAESLNANFTCSSHPSATLTKA